MSVGPPDDGSASGMPMSRWGGANFPRYTRRVGSAPLLVSLVTPHDAQGRVDLPRLRAHVLWLAAQGVDGFVATLTAGELPYLTDREKEAVHRTVLDAAGGRDVFVCTWDPSPATATWLTRF